MLQLEIKRKTKERTTQHRLLSFCLCFFPLFTSPASSLFFFCFFFFLIRPSRLPCFVSRGSTPYVYFHPLGRNHVASGAQQSGHGRATSTPTFSHFSPLFSRSLSPSRRVSFRQPRPFEFASLLTDPFSKTWSISIPFLYLDDANDRHNSPIPGRPPESASALPH